MDKGVYVITLDKVDYDQYIGFVIIAKSKPRAIELMIEEHGYGWHTNVGKDNIETITKIGNSNKKEGIYLDSFNAG
jgi:hypothetical protein